MEAILLYGKDWTMIEQAVGTRSSAQIRSHAQKYLMKIKGSTEPRDIEIMQILSLNLRQLRKPERQFFNDANKIDDSANTNHSLPIREFREKYTLNPNSRIFATQKVQQD